MSFGPVAAIAISDLHLTLNAPSCRAEKDWLAVMTGYFQQVKDYHKEVGEEVPIICAGDVFDKPGAPVELVNWAIRTLPTMYSVPGQHDCVCHRLEDIKKSAYWTLVETGVLVHLQSNKPVCVGGVRLHGFPWGREIVPWQWPHKLALEIAVIHKYIWTRGASYPGAPKEARAVNLQEALVGYDIAIVGDNHTPFDLEHPDLCSIYNVGTFMRRKTTEIKWGPSIVVIHQSGKVKRVPLAIHEDQFVEEVVEITVDVDQIKEFSRSLTSIDNTRVDFADVLRRAAENGVGEEASKIIRQLLEDEGK